MQQADFDHTHFQSGNNAADNSLLVKFFDKSIQDEEKTRELGRAVFKDVCYVDIRTVGSKNGHVCRPARPADIQRFPKHHEAYKQRHELPTEGTPLIEWPMISRSQAEELAYMHVKTVEQLASVSDGNISQLMGGYDLKARATKWLDEAKGSADAGKIAKALNEAKAEAEEQRARADSLEERLNALEAALSSKNTSEPKIQGRTVTEVTVDEVETEKAPTPTTSSRRRKSKSKLVE